MKRLFVRNCSNLHSITLDLEVSIGSFVVRTPANGRLQIYERLQNVCSGEFSSNQILRIIHVLTISCVVSKGYARILNWFTTLTMSTFGIWNTSSP
jgi:hypothetical protein